MDKLVSMKLLVYSLQVGWKARGGVLCGWAFIPFSEDSLKLQCLRISAFLWYSGSNTGSSEISGCLFCFRENELLYFQEDYFNDGLFWFNRIHWALIILYIILFNSPNNPVIYKSLYFGHTVAFLKNILPVVILNNIAIKKLGQTYDLILKGNLTEFL